MSSSSANDLRTALNTAGTVVRPGESVLSPVRAIAFWVAVALPFLYLPLLITGLDTTPITVAFLALLGANAVALFVGRGHHAD